MSWYGFALTHPHSVWACRYDVSDRGFDCEHCEHFHRDCELGEKVQLALRENWYDLLPKSLQYKIADKLMEETPESLDNINYKELLKK